MKKLLLCHLFFVLSNATYAQNTFEKVIDTLGCTEAKCVQQTFDGGYIVCGVSYYNNNDGSIVKLDSAGNLQWVKIYGGSGQDGLQRIEQLPDSGYVVSGTWDAGLNGKQWLLRLDDNGDTLWTNKYTIGNKKPETSSMASGLNNLYPMNGYVLVQPNDNDAYLMVADSMGGIAFLKTYGNMLTNSISEDVIKTFFNGYALTGTISSSPGHGGVWLIRTDSLGDTLWTKTYFHSQISSGYSLKQTSDSGLIIAGITYDTSIATWNIYLVKTDINGDSIWTKLIFYPNGSTVKKIENVKAGGYILTGRIVDTLTVLTEKLLLIRTNNYGDTVWTKHYPKIGSAYGNYGIATKDGGFIAVGIDGLAFYIVKTDSMGNVKTSVGITEANQPQFDFNIYPNPGKGLFRINFEGISANSQIKVLNNKGELILDLSIKPCNEYCFIDLSNYAEGIYLVRLENGKIYKSKKIVLIK